MRVKFLNFIEKHNLVHFGDRILLAVSGGIDSMVMLNLFHGSGVRFSVAHCNFTLRGHESDGDQEFVSQICQTMGVELFVKRFDTNAYARKNRTSIQVAARELRFTWFKELCDQKGFTSVAIAHNRNDVAETMLINLCRGTGLKGLTGMSPKSNTIIKPLLFASRSEIEAYAKENGISHREDSTNAAVEYARNRIRHNVIPQLEMVNPGVVNNLYSTSLFMGQAWEEIGAKLISLRDRIRKTHNEEILYSIPLLAKEPLRQLFLLEELTALGFSPSRIVDIEQSLFAQPGKSFLSGGYRLVRDREYLIVSPLIPQNEVCPQIDMDTQSIDFPINLTFGIEDAEDNTDFPRSPGIGVFDLHTLKFPLTLRKWKQGDWFIPLGMSGKKKISDFLTDLKIPLHRKERVYVLESDNQIIWVVGYRIDNRFRVRETTTKLFLSFQH